uniref:Uncharacterized protein n=1 Tax=Opuntia streptacantha TaxID=393608 RepID=A0A7C9CM76_OPUST
MNFSNHHPPTFPSSSSSSSSSLYPLFPLSLLPIPCLPLLPPPPPIHRLHLHLPPPSLRFLLLGSSLPRAGPRRRPSPSSLLTETSGTPSVAATSAPPTGRP